MKRESDRLRHDKLGASRRNSRLRELVYAAPGNAGKRAVREKRRNFIAGSRETFVVVERQRIAPDPLGGTLVSGGFVSAISRCF